MHKFHATALGYCGLIPFIGLPFLIIWGMVSYFEGVTFFSQYSAIILSFLGGVVWWHTIQNQMPVARLYLAMLPSLLGWFCVALLPSQFALIYLACAYMAMLLFEIFILKIDDWYRSLRLRLTAIACGGHAMMLWLILT